MQTRRFTHLPGMALAVVFTMLVGSVGADDSKLEGTWDVTLKFPEETCDRCGCPTGVANTPIPTLNTFLKGGGMLWSGGSLFAGPGQGFWERLGHNDIDFHDFDFRARFKFLRFDSNGIYIGSEELTKKIRLTGPDTFTATTTFDLLNAAGEPTAGGCDINETAERFE
jgi:hypothetical protein